MLAGKLCWHEQRNNNENIPGSQKHNDLELDDICPGGLHKDAEEKKRDVNECN